MPMIDNQEALRNMTARRATTPGRLMRSMRGGLGAMVARAPEALAPNSTSTQVPGRVPPPQNAATAGGMSSRGPSSMQMQAPSPGLLRPPPAPPAQAGAGASTPVHASGGSNPYSGGGAYSSGGGAQHGTRYGMITSPTAPPPTAQYAPPIVPGSVPMTASFAPPIQQVPQSTPAPGSIPMTASNGGGNVGPRANPEPTGPGGTPPGSFGSPAGGSPNLGAVQSLLAQLRQATPVGVGSGLQRQGVQAPGAGGGGTVTAAGPRQGGPIPQGGGAGPVQGGAPPPGQGQGSTSSQALTAGGAWKDPGGNEWIQLSDGRWQQAGTTNVQDDPPTGLRQEASGADPLARDTGGRGVTDEQIDSAVGFTGDGGDGHERNTVPFDWIQKDENGEQIGTAIDPDGGIWKMDNARDTWIYEGSDSAGRGPQGSARADTAPVDPIAEIEKRFGQAPQLDQSKIDAMIGANAQDRAKGESRALQAALSRAARAGMSPESATAMTGEAQHSSAIAGAQDDAKVRMDSEIQNFQANVTYFRDKQAMFMQLAQTAATKEMQQIALQHASQMARQAEDSQKRLMEYQNELNNQLNPNSIIGGILGAGTSLGTAALFGGL